MSEPHTKEELLAKWAQLKEQESKTGWGQTGHKLEVWSQQLAVLASLERLGHSQVQLPEDFMSVAERAQDIRRVLREMREKASE
jgi:hypothetical protein